MSDPPSQKLKIPQKLYHEISKWCSNSQIESSDPIMEEWRLLLATQKFNVLNLHGITQESMSGILRAYNSFRDDEKINASREGVRLASFVIDRPQHENGPSNSLPSRLAAALFMMTGLESLSLDLGYFSDGQAEEFQAQIAVGHLVWPRLHSLKFNGPSGIARTILRHCNPHVLHTLHLFTWTDSDIVEKARGLQGLKRLHLYYDRDDLADPATFACVSLTTWREIEAIGWVRIANNPAVFLECIILREASVEIQGHLDDNKDLYRFMNALRKIKRVVQLLCTRYLAFSFDHRRFSPRLVRLHENGQQNRDALTDHEVDLWYKKIIVDVMETRSLAEVWVFAYNSLAFCGKRYSDSTVYVVRRKLNPKHPQKNSFPWGVLDD